MPEFVCPPCTEEGGLIVKGAVAFQQVDATDWIAKLQCSRCGRTWTMALWPDFEETDDAGDIDALLSAAEDVGPEPPAGGEATDEAH